MLAAWLADLAERLASRGCTFIGHLKGMAVAPGEETLFFSLTRLGGEPGFKGGAWNGTGPFELSVSAILAGIGEEEIGLAMRQTLEEHFQVSPAEATT